MPSASFLPVIQGKYDWTQFAEYEGLGAFKMDVASGARAYVTIIVNPGKWRAACDRKFDATHPALAPKAGKRRTRRRAWLYRCSPGPAYRFPSVEIRPCVGTAWMGIDSQTFDLDDGLPWGEISA